MLNPSHCPHVVHASLASRTHPRKPNVRPQAQRTNARGGHPARLGSFYLESRAVLC